MPKTSATDSLPVVIIGAGLAGLTVALELAETHQVIIMAKRGLSESATAWAQGGIVGVLDQQDSVDAHVKDTVEAGAGLVVESTARYIAERSADAIDWLVSTFRSDQSTTLSTNYIHTGSYVGIGLSSS